MKQLLTTISLWTLHTHDFKIKICDNNKLNQKFSVSFSCQFRQFSILLFYVIHHVKLCFYMYIKSTSYMQQILTMFSVNKECKAHFGKMYQLTSVNEKNSPRPPTALKPLSIFESILALHVIQSCGKSGLVTVSFVPSIAVLLDLQMSTCSMHHFISSVLFVMNWSFSSYPQHWNNFCAWWINSSSLFSAYFHAC